MSEAFSTSQPRVVQFKEEKRVVKYNWLTTMITVCRQLFSSIRVVVFFPKARKCQNWDFKRKFDSDLVLIVKRRGAT